MGDPHTGVCTAFQGEIPDQRLRTCCNTGYARGACPSFPGGDAPDAVRFGIIERSRGLATIQYVIERDHLPHDQGILEIAESQLHTGQGEILERQARAYLASYLRRNSNGEV